MSSVTELIHLVTSSLNVQTVLLFAAVLALTVVWLRRPRNLPPGPLAWPILGNLPDLRKDMHYALERCAKRYGSITRIWLGSRLAIVLNDINTAKEALIKQADCFTDRMSRLNPKGSIIMSNGEIWKERRRFGLSALRTLGMGKRSIEHKINEESRRLLESFDDRREAAFDPGHTVINAVSNIICTISFGYRFEYSDPKFAQLVKNVKTSAASGNFTNVSIMGFLLNFLKRIIRGQGAPGMDKAIRDFIQGIVKEHEESFDSNDIRDIIDMFLGEAQQLEKTGGDVGEEAAFCKTTLWRSIFELFLAGTETTSNTLLWLLLYTGSFEQVQRKVQKEIDEVIGSDRQPTVEDRGNMPYTNAVIMEALRLQPVAPFGVPHKAHYQTELLGYTIPKDTVVFINIWNILRDPKQWENPTEFNPSRFLSKDGKCLEKPDAFMPFGLGRRICMGETLAKMELFLFFVNLLQQFTFSFPAGKPPPSLEGVVGFTIAPRPYVIQAKKR